MAHRMDPAALARKQIDRRLKTVDVQALARPTHGWLRAIRNALDMSTRQAAHRMGVSQPTYARFEKGEAENSITLASLRSAAEALDCTLVYAVVPNKSLDSTLRDRARVVAQKQLDRVHHTMRLEDQAMGEGELAAERERLAEELLRTDPRRLWDDA